MCVWSVYMCVVCMYVCGMCVWVACCVLFTWYICCIYKVNVVDVVCVCVCWVCSPFPAYTQTLLLPWCPPRVQVRTKSRQHPPALQVHTARWASLSLLTGAQPCCLKERSPTWFWGHALALLLPHVGPCLPHRDAYLIWGTRTLIIYFVILLWFPCRRQCRGEGTWGGGVSSDQTPVLCSNQVALNLS